MKAKYFELVRYHIELTNDLTPYGGLQYGHLTIGCRLKRGKLMHRQDECMLRYVLLYPSSAEDDITDELTVPKGMLPQISSNYDAIEDEFDDENSSRIPVYLLEVGFRQNGTIGPHGLILRKLGDSQFSRLGTGWRNCRAWYAISG